LLEAKRVKKKSIVDDERERERKRNLPCEVNKNNSADACRPPEDKKGNKSRRVGILQHIAFVVGKIFDDIKR
jgi:hypothetical protein